MNTQDEKNRNDPRRLGKKGGVLHREKHDYLNDDHILVASIPAPE